MHSLALAALGGHRLTLALVAALSVLSASAEALALAMFAPVVQSLTGTKTDNHLLVGLASAIAGSTTGNSVLVAALTMVLLFALLKNVLAFGTRMLDRSWLNSTFYLKWTGRE